VGAPRLASGYGALQWTRFHAARAREPRGAEHVRGAGRAAARTIDLLAPLPSAAEAARLALEAGREARESNPATSAALFEDVRDALDRVTAGRIRGLGLGALAREARSLDDASHAEARRP
jgi:hypothetical protein